MTKSFLILFIIYSRYSDGGRPACWMTNQNPSVEKLILVSTSAYALDKFKQTYARFRDINLWPEDKRRVFENIYGFDGLSKNFSNYLNEMMRMQYFIPPEVLKGIKCPTLILQGQRDFIISPDHATFIQKRIKGSKLWMFDADHNILKDKSVEVNRKIHEFLLNDN